MKKSSILALKSTPVYTIESIAEYPLNPYREFVYFSAHKVFPTLENKLSISLTDFNKLSQDEQCHKLETAIKAIGGEIKFLTDHSHKRIFVEAEVSYKGVAIAILQFFTHLTYINTSGANAEVDEEHVAIEMNFKQFDGFDFMNLKREDNILDFSKDDDNPDTIDMMIAHLWGLFNFTEFVKEYKAKSLVMKNIEMFTKKLIEPYVSDLQCAYTPDNFIIGVLCGENIHKNYYPYENYMNSIKEFANAIREKYGDEFKQQKENEALTNEQNKE